MRFVKNSSFINALELGKYPKIYFLKEQKPQFMKILRKMSEHLRQAGMSLEDAYACIEEDSNYATIRMEEPDLYQYRPLPLLQFIMPTLGKKTLVRNNRSLDLDKSGRPNMKLSDFYFPKPKQEEVKVLGMLKKRNCHVNIPKLRETIKQRKEKQNLSQAVFFDKYNDLLCFNCLNLKIVVQVLFAILDYNRGLDHAED